VQMGEVIGTGAQGQVGWALGRKVNHGESRMAELTKSWGCLETLTHFKQEHICWRFTSRNQMMFMNKCGCKGARM
jgi:hypothetical protein